MNCEMCGKKTGLFKTDVEGTILSLCEGCSKFGKVISAIKEQKKELRREVKAEKPRKEEETFLAIVQNYGEIIKKRREELGINQEDFAKKLNEKVSLIHKVETGHFEPSMDLARKIEKSLHIRLVGQQELEYGKSGETKRDSFTIGDFIKIK